MPAPTLSTLPPPPTRASPGDFPARADAFLGALPTLVNQINALVAYWNAELDTTAYINRNVANTMSATLTFAVPPVMRASATAGRQTAIQLAKGTTVRQLLALEDDGTLNIVPANGAQAALAVSGARVFTTAAPPTPAQVGALPASAYTAEDVLAKLQSVTGGSGSTVDAGTLAGQAGSYYRNASNLNAGTVADARLPSNIVRSTRRINTNSGSGLIGGGTLGGDLSLAVDATVARRTSQNEFEGHQFFQSGAIYVEAPAASAAHLWFRTIGGAIRGLIWVQGNSDLFRVRAYNAAGTAYEEAYLNGANGTFTAPSFRGVGSELTSLNAGAMDRGTLPDARLSGNIVRTSRTINTGGGLQGGGNLDGNLTLSVDGTVVRTSRTISAGNGLTGGGNMAADRAIALGTPGSITADSTNSVSATSHTHSISVSTIAELTSRLGAGAIGTYGAFKRNTSGNVQANSIIPGSQLEWSAFNGAGTGVGSPTGSWRCMGAATSFNGTTDPNNATLFLRVS